MSLIINTKNRKDEKFVVELLHKLGFKATSVDIDELEDIAYAAIMRKNNSKDVLTFNEAKAHYSKLKKKK
jgi:hypothetical protein